MNTGTMLIMLYLAFLVALILFCAACNRKSEEERQAQMSHWDEESMT